MKAAILAANLLLLSGFGPATAGQVDARFDGVWVGQETFKVYSSRTQFPRAPSTQSAVLAISDNGKTFGVLEGHGAGRYEVSSKSKANQLIIHSSGHGNWRTRGTFTLSADGKVLTETAFGKLPGQPSAVDCNITGTFHRKGKH